MWPDQFIGHKIKGKNRLFSGIHYQSCWSAPGHQSKNFDGTRSGGTCIKLPDIATNGELTGFNPQSKALQASVAEIQ